MLESLYAIRYILPPSRSHAFFSRDVPRWVESGGCTTRHCEEEQGSRRCRGTARARQSPRLCVCLFDQASSFVPQGLLKFSETLKFPDSVESTAVAYYRRFYLSSSVSGTPKLSSVLERCVARYKLRYEAPSCSDVPSVAFDTLVPPSLPVGRKLLLPRAQHALAVLGHDHVRLSLTWCAFRQWTTILRTSW